MRAAAGAHSGERAVAGAKEGRKSDRSSRSKKTKKQKTKSKNKNKTKKQQKTGRLKGAVGAKKEGRVIRAVERSRDKGGRNTQE